MRSRVLRRRAATAFGIYGSALIGFLATIVVARGLSKDDFARYAIVFGATSLLQLFVDLTVDEVVVKYGNRYAAQEDWGRFRRLFRVGLAFKMAGGALATVAIVVTALCAELIWTTGGLRDAMLVASLIPLIQQPEGMAGAVLLVSNRYDVRGVFLLWSMILRFVAIVIATPLGLIPLFVAIVIAQVVSSLSVGAVALFFFRQFPRRPEEPLGDDRRAIQAFALQSTIGSALTSLRSLLPGLLVGVVASSAEVADFRVAQAPQTAFQTLSAPARLVLLAEQTRDIEHGRADRALRLLRRYIGMTTLIAVVAVPPFWIWMPTFIRVVYKVKYLPATDAMRVMLLVAATHLVLGWTRTYPISIGRPGLRTLGQCVEIAVLVPAVLALASVYGATGAAGGVLAGAIALGLFWVGGLLWLRRHPIAAPRSVPA
jgi:O-antigen/teichoic acid export membrane protein